MLERLKININLKPDGVANSIEKNNFHSIENGYGKFTRSFQLPENIIEEKITAIHKNGMLNISVPKDSKTSIKKTIQIK